MLSRSYSPAGWALVSSLAMESVSVEPWCILPGGPESRVGRPSKGLPLDCVCLSDISFPCIFMFVFPLCKMEEQGGRGGRAG